MISHVAIPVPCPCGRRHRLPLDDAGLVQYACQKRRSIFTLRVKPDDFMKLMAMPPDEADLFGRDSVCRVHRAARPTEDGVQRCADCGWPLLMYKSFLRLNPRAGVAWWAPGALVGQTPTMDFYLVGHPLSPHREIPCHAFPTIR